MKQVHVAGDRHDNAKAARQIAEAIEDLKSIGLDDVLDRNRPYTGQPWTDDGARGQQQVSGVTFRDIRDCLILAFYDSRPEDYNPPPKDINELPLDRMDLEAISQNLGCWIERYMGIFPNVRGIK